MIKGLRCPELPLYSVLDRRLGVISPDATCAELRHLRTLVDIRKAALGLNLSDN